MIINKSAIYSYAFYYSFYHRFIRLVNRVQMGICTLWCFSEYIIMHISRILLVFFPMINSKWHECHFHQTDYSLALAYTWVNHIT